LAVGSAKLAVDLPKIAGVRCITMPKIVFTSDELPAGLNDRQRFSLWQDLFTARYGAVEMSRPEDRKFAMRCEFGLFNDIVLGRFEGTCNRAARTPHAVKSDGNDAFVFVLNRHPSRMLLAQNGQEVLLKPLGAGLVTNAEPGEFLGDPHNAWNALTLPSARLRELVPHPEDHLAMPLDPNNASLLLLRQYVDIVAAFDGVENEPALADYIGRTVSDLIALILSANGRATETALMRGLRLARVETILADIRAGFADPKYSPSSVAMKLGVSVRYVQDLLHETGVSFTERVMELRLQKARQMLECGDHGNRPITDIAFAAGFGDISHFNRCFRGRFGASPTQYRVRKKELA